MYVQLPLREHRRMHVSVHPAHYYTGPTRLIMDFGNESSRII